MKILVTFCRIFVGLLFIFSGFIKANDSLGFSYKLVEYFEIFGMAFLVPFAVYIAIAICVIEIALGYATLIGMKMKFTSWSLLIMIVFFTILTGYSAITGKVTDCGCFGDAIKLEPVESFYKDLILLVLIIVLFINRNKIKALFTKRMQYNQVAFVTIISTVFSIYCVMMLPVINFLNWSKDSDICENMKLAPDAKRDSVQMIFLYKVNGEVKEFDMNNIPENGEFVDRKDKVIVKGDLPKIHDFMINDANGNNLTDSFLSINGYKLMVVSYDLKDSREKGWKKLSILSNENSEDLKIPIWAFTCTTLDMAEKLKHDQQLMFNFYNVDCTALKAIIRSSPGVLLMKDCKVVKTWPSRTIPSYERIKKIIEKNK